jgi:type IV pilus assembly protein PilC
MLSFQYSAKDQTGKIHSGKLEASSEESAYGLLNKAGLTPVSLVRDAGKKKFGALPKRIKLKDQVIFTRQLSTMINAGVPLTKSLATLESQTDNPNFRVHISQITHQVEGGATFAEALESHSKVFSPIYINMVRAGESGGILDEILKKLATQQEKDAKIRGKFKSAMTYPIVLITITTIVFIGLMTVVVPKIGGIVSDLTGGNLPTLTRVMLKISYILIHFWYIHIALFALFFYLMVQSSRTVKGRYLRDHLLLKIPKVNMLVKKMAIARFSRIFASLMSAGVSVVESINITAKALGNAVIQEELEKAALEVKNGVPLSTPLSKSKVFPAIVHQMLAVGEETGQTDVILLKVADFYEDEVDEAVESLSSILEPIMIVVMGVMVALIAVSVIGPISSLSNGI